MLAHNDVGAGINSKRQAFETQLKSWKHLENIRIHNSTIFRFDISTYLQAVIYSVLRFWAGKECAALSDGDDPSALCLAVDHFYYCSCSRCWWAQTIQTCWLMLLMKGCSWVKLPKDVDWLILSWTVRYL